MAQAKNVYLCPMYVRKKHNRSGTTSVVVVSKASGKYKEIKSFGSSSSEEDIESLCNKAAAWIRSFGGQQEFDFDDHRGKEIEDTKRLLNNIDNILIMVHNCYLDKFTTALASTAYQMRFYVIL